MTLFFMLYNCVTVYSISFTQNCCSLHTSRLLTTTTAHLISLQIAAVPENQKHDLQCDDKQLYKHGL